MAEERAEGYTTVDKKWTMLVYLAGDNNLTDEMVYSLQSMRNELEENSEVNDKVGVVAQYDAAGLNPCLLMLNHNGEVNLRDGSLDQTKKKEFGLRDVFASVRDRVTVRPEHWASAILYHHRTDSAFRDLFEFLESKCSMTSAQAEQLATELLMQSFAAKRENGTPESLADALPFPDEHELAAVVAITKTALLMPTEQQLREAKALVDGRLHGKIKKLFLGLKTYTLRREPRVKDLARFLAKSPDAVVRNMRDLSSPFMLQAFMEDQFSLIASEHLQAHNYMVVLSGHGGGATGDFLPDEDPPSSLTIPILGKILANARERFGRPLDILGIDSCLMSMAEVAYEIQDSVRYLVASEGFVANSGWPYHRVLEVLAESGEQADKTAASEVEVKEAAVNLVKRYAAFYQDYEMGGGSTHLAALDLSAFGKPEANGNLAGAVKALAGHLKEALSGLPEDAEKEELDASRDYSPERTAIRDALILAHWYAQSFKWEKYVDLWDFCDQLRRFLRNVSSATDILKDCDAVQAGVTQAVLYSCYNGPEFQHAHGISIYFPWTVEDFSLEYGALKFAHDTGWFDFLVSYLTKTRRLRRAYHPDAEHEPRRLGSDVSQLVQRLEFLSGKAASQFGARAASQFGARAASQFGARAASQFGARAASQFGARMVDGKPVLQVDIKNVPDGFYRQDYNDPTKFIDKDGKEFRENEP